MPQEQNNEYLDLDMLKETMQFDPFGPTSNSGGDDEGGDQGDTQTGGQGEDTLDGSQDTTTGGQGNDSQQAPAGDQKPASSTQSSSQAPSGGDDKDKTIENLRSQIANMLAQPQPQPQGEAKPSQQPSGEQKPAAQPQDQEPYKISVSDQLVQGMLSEDPAQAKQAVSALANAVMNKLYQDFSGAIAQLRQEIAEAVSKAPDLVEHRQQVKTVQEQIEKDFYDNYPELKAPLLKDAVWTTVHNLAQRTGVKEWTPEFRDTAGQLLLTQLGITRTGPAPQPQNQDTGQGQGGGRQPRKTFAAGSGAGGGGRPNGSGATNEFADVLDVNAGF